MANEEHLARLKQGVVAWNQWRTNHPRIQPDLSGAILTGEILVKANLYEAILSKADLAGAHLVQAHLGYADLRGVNLTQANLYGAILSKADLTGATLTQATLTQADLSRATLLGATLSYAILAGANLDRATLLGANLTWASLSETTLALADFTGADLTDVTLTRADLFQATFSRAKLHRAKLTGANLLETNFEGADLTGCFVYGISAWNVKLEGTTQLNLVITPHAEPVITVDNLEVAQFIYLMLHNKKIREVIDTLTSKAVLILGRFTPEQKAVLDAIREELRRRNYLPIVFDFEKPANRDLTETISTLAHMVRFIIADITEAKSIPQELERIVPGLPSVPVQPLLHISATEYGMFEHFTRYPWVLETYRYESLEEVVAALPEKVIAPAEAKAKALGGSMRR